jgi:hypothetical protein
MKKIITAATIAFLVTATTTWANDKQFGGNEDMYQSPLMDHDKGAPTGEVMKGEGDFYGSHMANPEDVKPHSNARPEMPKGKEALHEQDPEGYGIK